MRMMLLGLRTVVGQLGSSRILRAACGGEWTLGRGRGRAALGTSLRSQSGHGGPEPTVLPDLGHPKTLGHLERVGEGHEVSVGWR